MNELEIIRHEQIEGLSLFLNTVDYRTPHLHSEWELIWVLENPLSVTYGQNQYLVEPGQMVLFNPGEPHVFRHTFCTNMANAGMDLKSLQYLMGHSDAGVTMNVYTHASYDHAEQSMQKILQFQLPEKALKSG